MLKMGVGKPVRQAAIQPASGGSSTSSSQVYAKLGASLHAVRCH